MLEILRQIIRDDLPELLEKPELWADMHIIYHPPRVERLWIQRDAYRLFLHRIHPCDQNRALWHPHPWPSAVRLLTGRYEHAIAGTAVQEDDSGHAAPTEALSRMILTAGCEYEMVHPQTWHVVRPLDQPSLSVMLVGAPYDSNAATPVPTVAKPSERQPGLSPMVREELFGEFRRALANAAR
ncbi:MAG: hypothetical protein ACPG4T_14700 [Nannocystaceae bacterium]